MTPTLATVRARTRRETKAALLAALKRNGWNMGATARELHLWPTSLRVMVRTHGLEELRKQNGRKSGRPRKKT